MIEFLKRIRDWLSDPFATVDPPRPAPPVHDDADHDPDWRIYAVAGSDKSGWTDDWSPARKDVPGVQHQRRFLVCAACHFEKCETRVVDHVKGWPKAEQP